MALLSVSQGFDDFFGRLTPLQSERDAHTKHRASVEGCLEQAAFGVHLFRQTGSFWHGTGIRHHCDVDLLVSIKALRPDSSDTALGWVKDTLKARFPTTEVVIRRPTVVVRFAGGTETWEILPGFLKEVADDAPVYEIPGPASGWMTSAPTAHLDYINEIDKQTGGGAKKLARLAKAWKYYNSVPISSFYLEMRAAQYMATHTPFVPVWDVCGLLEWLDTNDLPAMNDPKGKAGRFNACSSDPTRTTALSKLHTAATRARKALEADRKDDPETAFYNLNLLFGYRFPSR